MGRCEERTGFKRVAALFAEPFLLLKWSEGLTLTATLPAGAQTWSFSGTKLRMGFVTRNGMQREEEGAGAARLLAVAYDEQLLPP